VFLDDIHARNDKAVRPWNDALHRATQTLIFTRDYLDFITFSDTHNDQPISYMPSV
jgi:hypothetical protein